ncbi:unnamed protein product [Rotaria socialis]
MLKSKELVVLIINLLCIATAVKGDQCSKTKYTVSKCYNNQEYQWLIELPKNKTSCKGKSVAPPKAVVCNFACPKGKTFDANTLDCQSCPAGTFSLGGGQQHTFNGANDLESLPLDLSVEVTSLVSQYNLECKKNRPWHITGNMLQIDVQPNCVTKLSFRVKLERAGSITITYNLATSFVYGTISSRCDFTMKQNGDNNNDDDNIDESDSKGRIIFTLYPTGYGAWLNKKMMIPEEGEYTITLYTASFNTFHFPFAIRSIIVDGTSLIQECIPCPTGTYASNDGSDSCKPCAINTYADSESSTECLPCEDATQYSDEGSSKCLPRPICEAKHYRKVFIGCDKSNMATVKYEPIQPKICMKGDPPIETKQSSCGTCNPGMYKKTDGDHCDFCPLQTYSNGTLNACLPCENKLSLLPGLYYKIWNELPPYLNRSYMSFDETKDLNRLDPRQSWIPSIDYISSQALPDMISVLSLTISKGFRQTTTTKSVKDFGILFFKFSIQCQSSCTFFLVSQDLDDDDFGWEIIEKWNIKKKSEHKDMVNYTYSIQNPSEIMFNWLFTSDDVRDEIDEVRIYEISVTNTEVGGSDRCVSCLTTNNQVTECQSCTSGHILSNNTCIHCPKLTIASRVRSNDPIPTICEPCAKNTVTDDGVSCYVPCKQTFDGNVEYDLNPISTIAFHGSKLFTQKGSGYFHVFNTSICGQTSVTCVKTASSDESKRSKFQMKIDSKLCRIGTVPDQNDNKTSVAYIDDFGEELLNVSLSTSKFFPALRSDYNLSDIILVYRANSSSSQSSCSERITYLSLRCDHLFDDDNLNSTIKYELQTPNECVTGTCDGCTFHFLLRTPSACPTCDENKNGYRAFLGPCKFGRQEVRKIPYPYCSHSLTEKVETHPCSILSLEIKIIIGLFIIIASALTAIVIMCWRKNRKLEYRYMQLIENTNPDDDAPIDNVCAQISDEEDSSEEVQFKTQSRAKKIMNVVRKAIRKNPGNGQSEPFGDDGFLLASTSTNEA